MDNEKNPPAFPTEWSVGLEPGEPMQTGTHTASYPGMTLRDWFAGQALVGLMMHGPWGDPDSHAAYAYNAADAMLAARNPTRED